MQLQGKQLMLRLWLWRVNNTSAACRAKACEEAVQGVGQSGVMSDLLVSALVLWDGLDAFPHVTYVVVYQVLLNALLVPHFGILNIGQLILRNELNNVCI